MPLERHDRHHATCQVFKLIHIDSQSLRTCHKQDYAEEEHPQQHEADDEPPGAPRRLIGAKREGVTMHEEEQIQILRLSSRGVHGRCFLRDPYPPRPLARTRGSSTKCSERNQTCISFVRITSLTSKSFVPSSPASTACLAIGRDSNRMTSCAWSSRASCTGTSCRPRGSRGIRVVSATSCAIAMMTPPSIWTRSASESTSSLCSLKCLS